ncbi:hypothetical protein [Candidatus Mycolicibacterium alkanivorans]|uniref:Transposase n=1 Tax=Candidatus Mycolicibacterium alkanivorans TaxID=2954114 RepID=A0ABS9YU92_9MYCO|nr:hypothetical protein [Candidatus Mycolicibacterium alkanivorans]MCI4674788.1 hypothetical protein [Candidatus Mycolicibacterium alkanivorans]
MERWLNFWQGQGRATYSADSAMVGDRVVPSEIFVEIAGSASQPDLSMKIEVRQGIPVCTEVCLRSRPDGPEVREKDLAQVRVGWLVEQIVARASVKPIGRVGGYGFGWSKPVNDRTAVSDIRRYRSGRTRMSRERLLKVVEVYREHIDARPTEAVERAFDVSHRTAARYVQQARDAGLLPATTPGKKKA